MIFYYRLNSGHWSPVKAREAPYNGVDKGQQQFFYPWTDKGLGHQLTENQEDLTLEELMVVFPAPKIEPHKPASAAFDPTTMEKLVISSAVIEKVLSDLETQVISATGQGQGTELTYSGPSIEEMREALRLGRTYMKDVLE